MALYGLGQSAEAEASFREAMRLRPDHPETHTDLGYVLLSTGRLAEGWSEYEWRWKTKYLSGDARNFTVPQWNGEAIGDRVILLHAEQGLGDTLQFCRYVPLISKARIVLEAQAPLVRLLSLLPGVTTVVTRGDALPPFDLHCPLMSLPRAFGTTLDSIPATVPYLMADPAAVAMWRERLAGVHGLRVLDSVLGRGPAIGSGVGGDGSPALGQSLDILAPLRDVADVSFISLQKGEAAIEAAQPPPGMVVHDFTTDLHDFADTAALIECLDLVDQRRYVGRASGGRAWQTNLVAQSL